MDSQLLAQLKQWMLDHFGMQNGGAQPQGQGSSWMGMGGDQNQPAPMASPNAQAAEASMRGAFNYPK